MVSMDELLRPMIAEQEGYSAGHESAEVIMDANESPYDLPEDLKNEAFDRLRETDFNRYPDSACESLRARYADYVGVDPDWVVAGNGSDELITYLISATVEPGDEVLVPTPTFSMYNLLAEYLHATVTEVPLGEEWQLTEEFVEQSARADVTFLSYPNNPTANCFSRKTIERVIEQAGGVVVIDEAYFEFAGQTFVDRIDAETPLVVLRTLSKGFGLAGLRTGFLLAPPEIVHGINTVRLPYNLNKLSIVTAEVALDNRDRLLKRNEELLDQRDRVVAYLEENDFEPYPTDANFVLFRPSDPEALHSHLLDHGIRIRAFSEEALSDCLRLSVGTPEENDRLLEALEQF